MKRCDVRVRSASQYLRWIPRHYSTAIPSANAGSCKDEVESSHTTSELNSTKEDHEERDNSFSRETEETATRSSPKEQQLPLSPLMDPAFHAARMKYEVAKPPPSDNPTDFQKRLAKNPYAAALATPIRQCSATFISLPTFFLQDFTIMANPTNNEPWYVPRSLTAKHHSSTSPDAGREGSLDEEPASRVLPVSTPDIGPSIYVTLRQPLFQSFFEKKSGNSGRYKGFGLKGGRTTPKMVANVTKTVWRKDMDSFIPELMRRWLASELLYVSKLNKGYIVGCSTWEDASWKTQSGAILWMGQRNTEAGEIEEQEVPPEEFDVLRVGKDGEKAVPVYNLRQMMGKQWVEELKKNDKLFQEKILVLKHKKVTKELEIKLWRLQGYVALYWDEAYEEAKSQAPQKQKPKQVKQADMPVRSAMNRKRNQ